MNEKHHIKKARKEYNCYNCKKIINKGELYFAELATLAIGYHKLANVTVNRFCLPCAKIKFKDYFKEEKHES